MIENNSITSELWENIKKLEAPEENVSKFIFRKGDAVAETVLYRYPTYKDRTVICCSVQSGCPVGCRFCGSGDAFVRNLTTDEIVSQPTIALQQVLEDEGTEAKDIEKLQIMFMSMGEPMLNMKRLIEALRLLHETYPNTALLVSTSAPDVNYEPFFEVSKEIPKIGLQFSIHESTDFKRNLLIPFKKKLPLGRIAETGEKWAIASRRRPFFNYCVHEKNSSHEDVENLKNLFNPAIWEATLSVICERDETMKAAHERQQELTAAFMQKMLEAGYSTRMFDPAGQDSIGGGCGQLFYVQQWFKDHPDKARRSAGSGLPTVHAQ